MKKISYLLTAACALFALSSCEADKDPVYHAPTAGSFVLYAPAMADQYIELTEGNTLSLTTAGQPDYGYSAVATYAAQMSLTEDFAQVYDLKATEEHQSAINVNQFDVALGVCTLLGIENEDDYNAKYPNGMPYMKVYFRATCQLAGVSGSEITSNGVSYNYLKPYLAIPTPAYIYLVGSPTGWTEPAESNAAHYAPWRLFEPDNAIGSKVYSGTFDIEASPSFRFYTALVGWGSNGMAEGIGSAADDGDNTDVTESVSAEGLVLKAVHGKGNWNLTTWQGGEMTIVVDASDENNITVTLYAGSVSPVVTTYVYMVGNNGGWAEPSEANASVYDNWKLADTTGTGIYSNTFDFADFAADGGVLYCRFYQTLSGWGAAQWSSDAGGGNVDVTSGVAAPTFPGEGCFVIPATGHKIQVDLDTNQDQVTFTYVE